VIKSINEHGKECWKEANLNDPFSPNLFHRVERREVPENQQKAFHSNLGSLTVLDRLTGYGFGIRDVETGYRDPDGEFWLASGDCDVLSSEVETIGEAIEWVKKMANTCIPNPTPEERI